VNRPSGVSAIQNVQPLVDPPAAASPVPEGVLQAKPGHAGKQGQQQRQLPQVELAGLVRQHLANQYRPLRQHGGERRIRGDHGGRTRAGGG
jgi:hypothetical protein